MKKENKKYDEILSVLVESISKKYGDEKVESLRIKFRPIAEEAMKREIILQVISNESFTSKIRFLVLYPELVFPYILRIRHKVSVTPHA